MAKKAAKKKAAKVRKAAKPKQSKPKQSKREVEQVLRRGAIRKRPKEQPLPGMEEVVSPIPRLTKICGSLADCRTQLNDLKATEKGLLQAALPVLIAHKRTVYKAHGMELVHVHGDDKVRARLINDDSGESAETDETDEDGDLVAADAGEGGPEEGVE